MSTPYPFNSQSISSTQSHLKSDSPLTSSVGSSTGHLEHDLCEISSSAQHIEPNLSHDPVPVDDLHRLHRPPIPICGPEIQLARFRYKSRNDPIIEPQSPPHRDDFPGKPAEGDPSNAEKNEYGPVDGARWSDEEYNRFLSAAMSRKFPPKLNGVAKARERSEQRATSPPRLEGFRQTLDLLKEINRGNRAEFEAWNKDRGVLEKALADKGENLRAEYALHVEKIHKAHHARRHRRVTDEFYRAAKRHHMLEMRQTLHAIHDVANAMGILYSERAAVAQGCVPRHGENWGKLDLAACDPKPYVHALFPEFVPPTTTPQSPAPPPDDLAPADLPLPAQPGVLDGPALAEAWDEECRPLLAPLHRAALRGEWYEVLDRSRAGAEHARRVLAGGCDIRG